jgi:hypothetical protein
LENLNKKFALQMNPNTLLASQVLGYPSGQSLTGDQRRQTGIESLVKAQDLLAKRLHGKPEPRKPARVRKEAEK